MIVLLDTRPLEEYNVRHFCGAIHFPIESLRRDKFPLQLLGASGGSSIVVVVDDAESRHVVDIATKLAQHPQLGLPSVLLLTGGE